jgi:hypothetical protein
VRPYQKEKKSRMQAIVTRLSTEEARKQGRKKVINYKGPTKREKMKK